MAISNTVAGACPPRLRNPASVSRIFSVPVLVPGVARTVNLNALNELNKPTAFPAVPLLKNNLLEAVAVTVSAFKVIPSAPDVEISSFVLGADVPIPTLPPSLIMNLFKAPEPFSQIPNPPTEF